VKIAATKAERPPTLLRNLRDAAEEALGGEERDRLDAAGFLLLLVTVALTALPVEAVGPTLGTSHTGLLGPVTANRVVELFAFLTTAVTFLSRSNARPLRRLAVPLAAFAGIVLLGVVQLLPLPESLLQVFAPVNASVYHDTREALALFGAAGPSPRISLAPSETAGALLLTLAVGALFLSAANLVRGRVRRRLFAITVVLAAIAYAGRAIFPTALARPAENSDIAAAHLEIALALGFGIVWAEILTGRSRSPRTLEPSDRIERRILPLAGRLVVWLALGALVAWTGSRAGTAAASLTCLLLPFAANRHARAGGRWGAASGLALGATAVLIGIFVAAAPSSGAPPPSQVSASAIRRASVEAWKQFPVLGSGLGTFAEGFARVQPSSLLGRVSEPQCDALQILVTGGIVGAAFATLLAVSLLLLLVRAWLRQRHREESAYALAGAGALFSLLVHGLGASLLSDAAIATFLAAVLGAAWAAGSAGSSTASDSLVR
jgi:O-antigen ligase